MRDDLVQYRATCYFRDADQASALDVALPPLIALARDASDHGAPDVRLSGTLLLAALRDLMMYLGETWLGCGSEATLDEVLRAYAADHRRSLGDLDSPSGAATDEGRENLGEDEHDRHAARE